MAVADTAAESREPGGDDEAPDRLLTVYTDDESWWTVDPADATVVRVAVDAWRKTRRPEDDARVTLTSIGGGCVSLYASNIVGWYETTRTTRTRDKALSRAIDREGKEPGWKDDT